MKERLSKLEYIEKLKGMSRLLDKRKKQLIACATRHEKMVRAALDNLMIRYMFQKGYMCKGNAVRLVDFCLPGNKIILEIDGKGHKAEADRFREKQIKLAARKYHFLRITNEEIDIHSDDLEEYLFDRIYKKRLEIAGKSGRAHENALAAYASGYVAPPVASKTKILESSAPSDR